MKIASWMKGLCIGMVAGAAVGWLTEPKSCRKTHLGKTMQRVGNAMDNALDDISDRLH